MRAYILTAKCEVFALIISFDHAAITVKDMDATIKWYIDNLGFSVKRTIENTERGIKIAFLEAAGHAMLEFFSFIDPTKTVQGPLLKAEETGIKHLSFYVDELETLCQQLKNAGVEFTTFTPRRVVFKDLNDVVLEMRLAS